MKLSILNLQNNFNKVPVHKNFAAQNPLSQTAPTQTEAHDVEPKVSSAASQTNGTAAAEALKAQNLAQAPMPYKYIGEIELPFCENAKFYKMANGQKVVILNKKGPTVLKSYFNVGSMNEPDDKRGISHFNEHMAFNGTTDGLKAGDFFKIVNDMGAMTNASTGFSQTDYYISSQLLNDKDWDTSVSIQSKMLQSPAHTSDMIEKEKGPVTSEISMVGDRPENMAMNSCIKNLFQISTTSPDLVAGSVSNINKLTNKDTLDYYNLWYTPDNCTTVVTGEVDEKTAIDTIAKYFNKFKSVPVENRKYEEFKPIQTPVRTDLRMPKAQSSTIVMGFSGPQNNNAKETIMLELLLASMLGYKGARISKSLNKQQCSAAMNIERVGNRPQDPKAVIIAAQASPEKTEKVIKTIYDEINKLAYQPLSQEELDISKKYLKMTYSQISEYIPILESITPQDISEFAKKYLDLNKVSLSVVHPESVSNSDLMNNYLKTNPGFSQKMSVQGVSHKSPALTSFKGRIEDKTFDTERIKQYKLANNMEVILNPNTSDIACTNITLEAEGPANVKPAVPLILSVILTEGSKNKNYDQFYNKIHKAGMNLNFSAGFSSLSASSQSLSQDLNTALDSIKEVFTEPRMTPESFNFAKKLVKESLMNSETSAMDLSLEKLFPNRPQTASREEALKSIDSITLEEVQGLFDYLKNNSMAKAVVTAPFEKNSEVEKSVLNKLSTGLNTFKPFKIGYFPLYSELEKDKVITKSLPVKQADIVQAFKFKTNHNPKDHMTFYLMNTILGDGPYSRLFNDLREKQKLAYRVESDIDFMGDSGIIALGIKTTTDDKEAGDIKYDNVEKSLNGFKNHLQKIMNEKVSQEELNGAKLRMKTKLLNSIESSASQTAVLSDSKESIYGVKATEEKLRLIDSITPDDIQNAAKYIFSKPAVTTVIASEDTLKNSVIKPTE
ncbi:MAG: insulinase family protein [Clostridium sp.]|nr:insulinase family protein [Clostridium sp.]